MIGDASKPYVSRMTTAIDIRNADGIDVLDVIDRSSHKTIDRFHRFHRSHRSCSSIVFHRSHRSRGSFPPPRLAVVVVASSRRVVAFVRDARESAARSRGRIGARGRDRRSFVRSFVRLVPLSSRLASSRVFTARVSPRRDVDEMASAMGADVEEGKTTPTPPVDWRARNPLKQLFFAQVSPLIAEGTVRRLEPTDLCHLDALDSQRVRARRRKRR
jgi:hypothetical protein